MNPYLLNLIARMQDETPAKSSEDSISFKAHREAENLKDSALILELTGYINAQTNAQSRKQAYFILGKLALNLEDEAASKFLIERIKNETDASAIQALLFALRDLKKPATMDVLPLFWLIESSKFSEDIKNDAIYALKGAQDPRAQPFLLNLIPSSDEFRLWYLLQSLASVATRTSFTHLVRLAEHKKQDVAASALFILISKGDHREVPIFERFIREGRNKDVALLGIATHGDESCAPLVIARLKEILSSKRSGEVFVGNDDKTEVMIGAEFLQKFSTTAEVCKFFDLLIKKRDKLFECELKFIRNLGVKI